MAYLSYAKGFKTGGWTTRLTAPLPPGSPAQSFGPETDNTYELGLKSEWFDRRLIVNAATFFSKYDGIQLTYQVVTSPVTENAGDAQIKGLELEGSPSSLTTSRSRAVSATWTLTTPGSSQFGSSPYDWAAVLPKTPRWKAALSPDVHTKIANGGTLRLGVDYTFTSEMFNDVQNTPLLAGPNVKWSMRPQATCRQAGRLHSRSAARISATNATSRPASRSLQAGGLWDLQRATRVVCHLWGEVVVSDRT